jgi:acyl-ACP thioesterase
MRSTTEIRVRGYHVDVFGHVNHARYVEFLDRKTGRPVSIRNEMLPLHSDQTR